MPRALQATCVALAVASSAVTGASAAVCEISGAVAPAVITIVATARNPSVEAVKLRPDCSFDSISRNRGGTYAPLYASDAERIASFPVTSLVSIFGPLSRGADLTGAGNTLVDVSFEQTSASASGKNFVFPSSVKNLRFANTDMSDFESLKVPESTTSLTIQDNKQLKSLKNIRLPASITSLDLSGNQLGALDFALPSSLQMLTLSGNPITKLEGIALSASLTSLICDECQVTSVRGVKLPKNLFSLTLGSKTVTSFEIRKSDLSVLRDLAESGTLKPAIDQPKCADKTAEIVTVPQGNVCVISDERFNEVYAGGPSTTPSGAAGTTPSSASDSAPTASGSKADAAGENSTESSAGSLTKDSSSIRKDGGSQGAAGDGGSESEDPSASEGGASSAEGTALTSKKTGRTSAPGTGKTDPSVASASSSSTKTTVIVLSITGVVIALLAAVVGFRIFLGAKRTSSDEPSMDTTKFTVLGSPRTNNSGDPQNRSDIPEGYLENDVRNDKALSLFRIDNRAIQIGAMIARGSFGVIHRGYFDAQKVAIRQMLPDTARDEIKVRRYMDEIRACVSLDHPKIARCFGICWTSLPDLAIVTEYMARGDLHSILQMESDEPTGQEWLEPWTGSNIKSKTSIAADIAEAMVYLHSFNSPIIHRNLKASSVLMDKAGNAKLNGFGICREVPMDETMTEAFGAVAWISPEVLHGEKCTEKADIYSLGVLLVEMDRCRHPYASEDLATTGQTDSRESNQVVSTNTRIAILVSTGKLRPTPLPSCPDAVKILIDRCLSFEAADRPNAMEVHHALRQIHKGVSISD